MSKCDYNADMTEQQINMQKKDQIDRQIDRSPEYQSCTDHINLIDRFIYYRYIRYKYKDKCKQYLQL